MRAAALSFLASPAQTATAGLAVFAIICGVYLGSIVPVWWQCNVTSWPSAPPTIELICAGLLCGCLLHHGMHLFVFWFRVGTSWGVNQEIFVSTTAGFAGCVVLFFSLGFEGLPWACSTNSSGYVMTWHPLRQAVQIFLLSPLCSAVALHCGASPSKRAVIFTGCAVGTILRVIGANVAPLSFGTAIFLYTAAIIFYVLAAVLILSLLRPTRAARPGSSALITIAVLAQLLQVIIWLACSYSNLSLSFQRSFWAITDMIVRVSTGVLFIITDLQWQASVELLEKQRAAAESANEAQKLFTRWLFHELRVPMQSMVLSIEELQEVSADTDQQGASTNSTSLLSGANIADLRRDCISAAQAGAAQVCRLLDSVLTLAKIEAGATTVEDAPFDVSADLLVGTTAMFRSALAVKEVSLIIKHAPSLARTARGDAAKLKMALANFVSNAIKYSPMKGVITVTVSGELVPSSLLKRSIAEPRVGDISSAFSHSDSSSIITMTATETASTRHAAAVSCCWCAMRGLRAALLRGTDSHRTRRGVGDNISEAGRGLTPCLRLCVSDEGAGISPADMKLLFRPFVQVQSSQHTHSAASGPQGSSGLGLSICQRMIALCGGRVGVVSEVGKGTTFWLEVPIPPDCAISEPVRSHLVPATLELPEVRVNVFDGQQPQHPDSPARKTDQVSTEGMPGSTLACAGTPVNSSRALTDSSASGLISLRWAAVVDDVRANRVMFARLLTRRGVQVLLTAEHGIDCLAQLDALPPDQQALLCGSVGAAWFIDKTMPVMGGLELTRRLRTRPEGPVSTPIFAVTGDALQEDQAEYIAGGATAVIPKPSTVPAVTAGMAKAGLCWLGPRNSRSEPASGAIGADTEHTLPR